MKTALHRIIFIWLLSFLLINLTSYAQSSRTTYNFSTPASLSFGTGGAGIWYTQADITIGGTAYVLTCGGNGSFSNETIGGNGNSASLAKDGAGGDQFSLRRADNQPFQFYGIWVKHQSMNSYSAFYTLPPWYTLTASTFTYQDNTPMTPGTAWNNYTGSSIAISAGSGGITTTSVSISFQAILEFIIDDIDVGPVASSPATVTTQAVSAITATTATGNGTLVDLGIPNPTAHGVCWNTSGTPTVSDSKVNKGAAGSTGTFTASITGLTAGTTYYVRAYATNSSGTSYGSTQSFTTSANPPTITTTPTLNAPYGKEYSYSIVATKEGALETSLTAPTLPSWLSFSTDGQNQAVLFGNVPSGTSLSGVAGDDNGNIYAITSNGATIYKIASDGTTTVFRSGLTTSSVYALHIANGYIYIPRYLNTTNSITRIPLSNPSANEETFASFSGGALSLVDKDGWIYASEINGYKVYRINETTKENQLFLSSADGLNSYPFGLCFDSYGNLYIAGWTSKIILKYDGSALTTVLSGLPSNVSSIRQDKNGNFFLSMSSGGVRKYTNDFSSYELVSVAANDNIWSLSFTSAGSLVYAKFNANEVYRLQTGAILTGTPAKTDLGSHPVVLRASNTSGFNEQSFTIIVTDETAPVISGLSPADNATNVDFQPTLSMTFDEEVSIGTTGTFVLKNGGTILKTFDLSVPADKASFSLSGGNKILSVSLTENLPVNTPVAIEISAGFVKDNANNNFAGITAASGTWNFTTLNKVNQTITFPAIAAKTYGNASFTLGNATTDKGLTVTYTATDPSVVSITGNQATILKAGSTTITASQAGDATHFAASSVDQTLTVNKAVLTATADDKTKVYGATNPTLTFQYSGWVNGVETIDTPPTASTTVDGTTVVGTYANAISLSGGSDNNYTFSLVSGDFEVTKAVLTATADDKTKVYGATNPTLTFQYSGWVNGVETIDTPPTASTTVDGTTAVGTYANAISLSGGSDNNYTFSLVSGDFEVTKAVLTATADDKTKVYGATNPTLTFQYSGWVNGVETIDTPPTASTTVDGTTAVGTHANAISLSGGSDNNYTFSLVSGDFEVTKAVLTATADDKTKVYGATNPTLTFQYSGWVNGVETIDTPPTASTTVDGTTAVGTHANAISLSGGSDNNYTFSLVSGDFEVTKAVLTATADDKTKVYGATNPTLTFQYSGWVNGVETIDTPPTASTTVDGTTVVGTYANAISLNGGSDNNYTFSLVSGDFEVTKAVLTATADDKTKVYGATNPTLTFQYSGWVNGVETIDTPPTASTTVDGTTVVGTYANAISLSGGSDNNYTFSLVSGDFEVTKAVLTATADDKTKVYGATNPTLTFQYSGWVNGVETIDTPPTASTTVDGTTVVGTYADAISLSGGSDNNYTFSLVSGDFEVTKAVLTATADDKTKVYGATNPTLTFQYSGWVNGVETIDTPPTASTTVNGTTVVGTYANAISLSGGSDNNYTFSLVSGDFEVTKAVLTATADDKTKVYGATNPTLTFQYSGWVNGVETIDTPPTASTTVDGTTVVGTYANAISLSGGSDNNYTFSLVAGDFEVTKAELAIYADHITRKYGISNPTLTYRYVGFRNGDSEASLNVVPVPVTSVTALTPVGYYENAITFNAGSDDNYSIIYMLAHFTIVKADQHIQFPEIAAKTYGDSDFAPIASASSGLMLDFVSSNPAVASVSGNRILIHSAGTTTITASQTGNENYLAASEVSQVLVVNPKVLTVNGAIALSKTYDATTDATIQDAVLAGLVGTDVVYLQNSSKGTFAQSTAGNGITVTTNMTISGDNALNYTLSQPDYLMANILKKEITVKAHDVSRDCNENDPKLSYGYSPALIGADTFTGSLTRTPGNELGNYPISVGTLALTNNYELKFVPASFTIADNAPIWLTLPGALDQTLEYSQLNELALAQALAPEAYDICDQSPIVLEKTAGKFISGPNCSFVGTITNTWTAKDSKGNVSNQYIQTIKLIDRTEPRIQELPSITIDVEPGICETAITFPEFKFNEDCITSVELVSGLGKNDLFPVGTTLETWKVTDASGNSSLFTFAITVKTRNAEPKITQVEDILVTRNSKQIEVPLSGIDPTSGCQVQEVVSLTASSDNPNLIPEIAVEYKNGESTGKLILKVKDNMDGEALITVFVKDNGGTENGGKDTKRMMFTVKVDGFPTAISELNKTFSGIVYPNPSSGKVTIKTDDNSNSTVKVYSAAGSLVYSESILDQFPHTIDLSDKKPGVYFIVFEKGKDQIREKLILKR